MAVALTQLAPASEDRASGAQIIDGSLVFDGDSTQYLEKTFSSAGNRQSWTWSGWVKKQKITNDRMVLFGGYSAGSDTGWIELGYDDDKFYYTQNSVAGQSTELFRDTNGWQHVVITYNGSNVVFYSNGEQIYSVSKTGDLGVNSAGTHRIGRSPSGNTRYFTGQISNTYFIDGQVLDPSNFAFTDPLTNTWRPKKASITGPNDGTVWSGGSYTGTTPSAGYGVAEAFNGVGFPGDSFGSGVQWGFFPGTATLTLGKPITLKSDSTFEIYSYHSSSSTGSITFTCSNGSVSPSLTVNSTNVIGSTVVSNPFSTFGAQITAITLVSSGSDWTAIAGIAVDGVVLMDSDTTNFGPNGFYLPMDGNTPVGFDESGRGNNFTPVNFGGSVGLDKATGALPILNTNGGGSVANAGVRTDAYAANLVLALPLVGGTTNDLSNSINSTTTAKTITNNGNPSIDITSSNFYSNSLDFDASGDYLSSSSSTDFAFGTGDFTIEYWVNYDDVSTAQKGDFQTSDASGGLKTTYGSGIKISFGSTSGELAVNIGGSNVVSASGYTTGVWYHNAITREGSTVRFFRNGVLQATASNSTNLSSSTYLAVGGYYNTSYLMNGRLQDFRIYKGVAKYTSNFLVGSTSPDILPNTPSGVATKTALTKISEGAVEFDGTNDYMTVASGAGFAFGTGDFSVECFAYSRSRGTNDYIIDGRNGSQTSGTWSLGYGYASGNGRLEFATGSSTILECPANLNPEAKQWHHIVVTRSGSTNRMFIDGVLAASATDSTNFSTEPTTSTIGARYSTQHLYDGFISNIRVVKGSIPTEYQTSSTTVGAKIFTSPTSQLTNVTNTTLLCCHDPLSSVGSIVTPGNITAYGAAAGNTFNPFNTDINTIRGQETTYATLNPLDIVNTPVLTNGNLDQSETSSEFGRSRSTLSFDVEDTKGYYAEGIATGSSAQATGFGIIASNIVLGSGSNNGIDGYKGLSGRATGWWIVDGNVNGTSSTGYAANTGDVLAVAAKNGIASFYVNGNFVGTLTGLTGEYSFLASAYGSSNSISVNFGQKPFKFTPPDGYQLLTGSSLRPETVVPDGGEFFAAVPYTGNSATNKITTGFAPDFVWIKNRDDGYAHCLFDTVRGAGKRLESDATYGEDDYNLLNTFRDNGFTLGVQGGGGAFVQNTSGVDSMSWSWKAGGNKNTFNIDDVGYASAGAAGLDGGSTNPTGASVNTKSKFGIYTFDGNSSNRTMSHGLGQQPDFMICKKKSTSGNAWVVWHSSIANTEYLLLNSYAGKATDATLFNSHASDSSTLWTLGSNTTFNESGQSSVAYLWCDVPGLQKFGTYEGNASSGNGPFVELGFRPAMIMIHNIDINSSAADWVIYDTARNTYNPAGKQLYPNRTIAEADSSSHYFDILSNGFKVRSTSTSGLTNSSHTFIYCAWAEAPAFNMFGATSNAR